MISASTNPFNCVSHTIRFSKNLGLNMLKREPRENQRLRIPLFCMTYQLLFSPSQVFCYRMKFVQRILVSMLLFGFALVLTTAATKQGEKCNHINGLNHSADTICEDCLSSTNGTLTPFHTAIQQFRLRQEKNGTESSN